VTAIQSSLSRIFLTLSCVLLSTSVLADDQKLLDKYIAELHDMSTATFKATKLADGVYNVFGKGSNSVVSIVVFVEFGFLVL